MSLLLLSIVLSRLIRYSDLQMHLLQALRMLYNISFCTVWWMTAVAATSKEARGKTRKKWFRNRGWQPAPYFWRGLTWIIDCPFFAQSESWVGALYNTWIRAESSHLVTVAHHPPLRIFRLNAPLHGSPLLQQAFLGKVWSSSIATPPSKKGFSETVRKL